MHKIIRREHKWQTKPLSCYAKIKEMRVDHYKEVASARERGKLLVTGSGAAPIPLLDGLGDDVLFFIGQGYAGSAATNPVASTRYMVAAEERGYARDMCSYMRNYCGSMFSNHFLFTDGPFPKPHFCFTQNWCDAGDAKWFQIVAEHYDIPLLVVDVPWGPGPMSVEQKSEFVAGQLAECIVEMERITGRTFDDERFISASRHFFESEAIWGEICLLNSAVPAPLDLKMLFAMMPMMMILRNKAECVAALRELRDEVNDRIAQRIGAVEIEGLRLITDQVPPWGFTRLFRSLQGRGVTFVGLWMYTVDLGIVDIREDGSVHTAKTPGELGWPMRTREEAIRVWGRHMVANPYLKGMSDLPEHVRQLAAIHRHWKSDGIVLQFNRGCPMGLISQPEVKARLEAEGIPVADIESNCGDARDTDTAQITKRLSAFVDLLAGAESLR